MKNKNIIIVGIQPWDMDIGSNCRNLAVEFAKQNRVLYVNYALDRITRLKNKNSDLVKKRLDVIRGNKPDLVKVGENLWNFTPKVELESINWIKSNMLFGFLNKRNNIKVAKEINTAISRLGFKEFVLFNDNDIFRSYHLKELLNPTKYIYYLRDYVVAVDYWKRHGANMEAELMAKADCVLANSTYLAKYAAKSNNKSFYVGQGCDLTTFNPDSIKELPNDVIKNKRPLIGYVGALKSLRLDLDIIAFIANSKPEWDIILVGPEDEVFQSSELHSIPNIKFLGSKDPNILPAYIESFDVCINPQIINEVTIGNYPRKIDEYLAMGKPVIGTKTEAMSVFEDIIYQASTKEEYVEMIEKALQENSNEKVKERIQFASNNTWENSVTKIYKNVESLENDHSPVTNNLRLVDSIKDKLKRNYKLKNLVHRLLIPTNQARPRIWVQYILNPFFHKKGKNAKILRRVRKDVLPFNRFEIGRDSTIEDFSTINNGLGNVIIGERVRVGLSNTVIGPVKIKNDVIIAQNVVMSGINHGYEDITLPPHDQKCSVDEILIEDEVWIGANCVILPGVKIGKHSVVAAGSVVTKSVPDYSVVAGNPAKLIKQHNSQSGKWEKVINRVNTEIKKSKAA